MKLRTLIITALGGALLAATPGCKQDTPVADLDPIADRAQDRFLVVQIAADKAIEDLENDWKILRAAEVESMQSASDEIAETLRRYERAAEAAGESATEQTREMVQKVKADLREMDDRIEKIAAARENAYEAAAEQTRDYLETMRLNAKIMEERIENLLQQAASDVNQRDER